MYRWNSRTPTVRWKDDCLSDSSSITSVTTEDTAETITKTNILSEHSAIKVTNRDIYCGGSNGTNSNSCVGSGGNLSGSTLTSVDPITLLKPEVPPGVNGCSISSSENPLCNFDTTQTILPSVDSTSSVKHSPFSNSILAKSASQLGTRSPKTKATGGSKSTSDDGENNESAAISIGSEPSEEQNVIKEFLSLIGILGREIRTLTVALFLGLLVNPINYYLSSSASRTPSRPRTVPGGSSSRYHSCSGKSTLTNSECSYSRRSTPHISATLLSLLRFPFFCTCNCISFLVRRAGGIQCGECIGVLSRTYKKSSNNSHPSSCCSGCRNCYQSSIAHRFSGVARRGPGKMAHILSKTMTLLGVAFVIHFIIMSTFAEREGLIPQPRFSSLDGSKKYHYHHHNHDEMETQTGMRRLARSYRHEKHPTSSPSEANAISSLSGPNPRLLSNKSEAVFSTENSTIIIAQIGSKTYLPCAVRNLGSGVASWIRRRDYHLLTVGMGTYSNDDRFMVSHNRPAQSWELHIKFVKPSDEGLYECQISTHPPSSIFVHLRVVEAKAEILGEPDKHVRSGSTFELVCVLRDSTEPPVYVFWYHNDRMINYDNVRGVQVSSDSEKSILTIQDAQKSDSGNYTCTPSNARPTSISVHILNGEKPAAMQHGSRSHSSRVVSSFSMPLLFVSTFVVFLLTTWLSTTNQSQQNLYYLQQHRNHLYHQYKQGRERKNQQKRCNSDVPRKALDKQRKLSFIEKSEQRVCTRNLASEQTTSCYHLYLQLVKKLCEDFDGGVSNGYEEKGNSHKCGEESDFDKSETNSVKTIFCIFLLLQMNERAVGICPSKSNLKKPQSRRYSSSVSKKSPMIEFLSQKMHGRRLFEDPVSTALGRRFVLSNNAYEYCYPRQIANELGERGGKIKVDDTARKSTDEDDRKVDQNYHSENHINMSSLATNHPGENIEGKGIVSAMMKRKEYQVQVNFHPKWDSHLRQWVGHEVVAFTKPQPHDNPNSRNVKISLEIKEKVSKPEMNTNYTINNAGSDAGIKIPSGVASQNVMTNKQKTEMLTTFSIKFSLPSSSQPISPVVTFQKDYTRFINSTVIIMNNPGLTGFPSQIPSVLEEDDINFTLVDLGSSQHALSSIPVTHASNTVGPVYLVVVLVTTIVLWRKEVNSCGVYSLSVVFPLACSYYDSPTTNGRLVRCLPSLFISFLFNVTIGIMPTITTPTTTDFAAASTTKSTMNTSKTSFLPLFSLRNKTEEADCLPQLLVKRLLQQPGTFLPPSSLEYYIAPTTNNINSNAACRQANLHSCYRRSYNFHAEQTVTR